MTTPATETVTPPAPRPIYASSGFRYAVAASLGIALAAFFWWSSTRPRTVTLRVTAGDTLGRRFQIAQVLARDAKKRGVFMRFIETGGSADALKQVSEGKIDCALIQGGIGSAPHVQEVAVLSQEPLHLLVKKEIADAVAMKGLRALRGKNVNLSTQGSGTRRVALVTLGFADMKPGRDFVGEDASYGKLENRAYRFLPDALFTVSLVPSPVVEYLVAKHGYRLLPVNFARAVSLRHPTLHETTIPAFAYGVVPAPTPPAEVTTIGTQLLLIARDDVPEAAIKGMLQSLFAGEFARDTTLTGLAEARFLDSPEMPIHAGAMAYRDRNSPVVTSDFVQGLEDGKSLLLSVLVSGYFVFRWFRQRRYRGFDTYLSEVTRVERAALALEAQATPPVRELMVLRAELGDLKSNALEKYARGELKSEELMSAFLTHVADVRGYLSALILAERERITEQARNTIPDAEQNAWFRAQWESPPTPP